MIKKETLQCEKDGDESWFCINLFILYLGLNIIHDKILFIWAAINLLKYSNNNPLQDSSILLKHLKVTTWPHVMWKTFQFTLECINIYTCIMNLDIILFFINGIQDLYSLTI